MTRATTSAAPVARPRARRGEGARTREEILDAAEALLAAHGSMDAVSIRMVAAAVGVSPPALYQHFEDKDALFFEVCQRRFAEFGRILLEARAGPGDAAAAVRRCGRAYVDFGLQRPAAYRVLFGGLPGRAGVITGRDPEELAGVQAFRQLVGVVEHGVREGSLRPVDPLHAALALWAVVHGLVSLLLMQEDLLLLADVDSEAIIETTLDAALEGLRAPS